MQLAAQLLYAVRHAAAPAAAKGRGQAPPHTKTPAPRRVGELELTEHVERLAYTREQAAKALGMSVATLDRRVVPVIATVETEWGARLIPVAELERYLAERTQQPRRKRKPPRRSGRKAGVSPEVVERIRGEHAKGSSLAEIARALNTDRVRTAQGGRQWWPSTVRTVLARTSPPTSAQPRRDMSSIEHQA
jgi:hypothetical protein